MDWTEIILRLGVATLAGGLIGLNRDLHGKPIGLKTLALVSLATAMLLVMVHSDEVKIVSDAGSRVIQGILTGIGFLGAGVIVHAGRHFRVRVICSREPVSTLPEKAIWSRRRRLARPLAGILP